VDVVEDGNERLLCLSEIGIQEEESERPGETRGVAALREEVELGLQATAEVGFME
jgi:hypothetical protein